MLKLLNFDLLGAWRSGGMKSSDFYCKGTSLRENTSFEPFCVKVRWGSDPRAEIRVKRGKEGGGVRKSRTPIGMTCRR